MRSKKYRASIQTVIAAQAAVVQWHEMLVPMYAHDPRFDYALAAYNDAIEARKVAEYSFSLR